eukprot:118623-Chlamydomonas_euryale.AAC.2
MAWHGMAWHGMREFSRRGTMWESLRSAVATGVEPNKLGVEPKQTWCGAKQLGVEPNKLGVEPNKLITGNAFADHRFACRPCMAERRPTQNSTAFRTVSRFNAATSQRT